MFVVGIRISIIVATLALAGCCSSNPARNPQQNILSFAAAKFGQDFDLLPNGVGDFVLCMKKEKLKPGSQPVTFFVYSTEKDTIVYERQMENGTVRWLDDRRLSIVHIPGTITGDENPETFTEVYDVVTRASLPAREEGKR